MRHHRDTQFRPSRESQLKVGDITHARVLPRRLTADCHLPAGIGDGLRDKEILGEISAELLEAADVVEHLAPDQRGHARVTVHAEEVADQIHPRLVRAEIDFLEGRGEAFAVCGGEGKEGKKRMRLTLFAGISFIAQHIPHVNGI